MEFVAAGWCTGKYLRLDQTMSLLGVIRLEVTRLKKTGFVYLLDLLGERGEGPLYFTVCGVPLDDWTNSDSVDVFFTCDMVLVLWGGCPSLGNEYGT